MVVLAQHPPHDPAAKVLIVDDHPVVREGLAIRLASQKGLQVCGDASDIPGALQMVAETSPDIVVVDISLKGGSGIDLVKRIRDRDARIRVVVWSMYKETVYAERALRAGASGYVDKEQATDTIVAAIRHVLSGGVYLSPAMTESMLRQAVSGTGRELGSDPVTLLSDRELEVFRLIGLGLDTHQIADRLHLSPKTVETYRGRARLKLGADTGMDVMRLAILWAMETGAAPGASVNGTATVPVAAER